MAIGVQHVGASEPVLGQVLVERRALRLEELASRKGMLETARRDQVGGEGSGVIVVTLGLVREAQVGRQPKGRLPEHPERF